MGNEYGRIKTIICLNYLNICEGAHLCLTCGFRRAPKVGIKVHLGKMRSCDKLSDIERPYCPDTFGALQTINRTPRNFVPPDIEKEEKT